MNYFTSNYINSSIAQLATRYVGQYLDGIEPDKFEVAWKRGDLQLNDVRIRQEAVDLIGLPIKLIYGWVGNVKISLPIKNFFRGASVLSEPLVIELDELYIVVAPKPEQEWSHSDFVDKYRLSRQQMIDKIDVKLLAAHAQKQLETTAKGQKGWMARIASRLVEDIQFNIRSVHLRYEDTIGSQSGPFSFGITLESLLIRTPKLEDLNAIEYEGNRDTGQKKLLRISEISVYWNSSCRGDSFMVSNMLHEDRQPLTLDMQRSIRRAVNGLIARPSAVDTTLKLGRTTSPLVYILQPLSCSVLVDVGIDSSSSRSKGKSWQVPNLGLSLQASVVASQTAGERQSESPNQQNEPMRVTSSRATKYSVTVDLARLELSIGKQVLT